MAGKVTKDMGLIEIVQNHPEALEVFAKYGLGCIGCLLLDLKILKQVQKFTA